MKGDDLSEQSRDREWQGERRRREEVVNGVRPNKPNKRAFPQSFASRGPVTIADPLCHGVVHGVVVHQCVSSLELWSPCLHAEDDTGSPSPCASILVFGLPVRLSGCFWGGWKCDRRDHAGPRQPVLLAGIRRVPSVARW